MTREEFLVNLFLVSDEEGTDGDVSQSLKDHDQTQRETIAEQRAEIARLKNDLSHWTFVRYQQLESENKRLREALKHIYAIVMGECPSLLNEDSGGDAVLCLEIENILKETP